MQEKRKKLEQDVLELRGKKNELEKRINDMVKCYTVLRTYPDFIVHRDLLAAQVKEAKDSLDSLSGSIDEMAKEIETTEGVVRDTERSYTKSSKWDAQRDSLISQINRLRKEFNSLPNDLPLWYDKDLEEVETKIKQLQEQLDLLVLNLVEKKLSFQEKENDVKLRRQTLSEAVRNLGTRQETLHSIMLRKELQSYLRNNRARLMGDTWGRITDLTSGYASQVTDGLIRNLMRDDDGGFTVEEGEHKVPVNELSGGRQSVVGLALRVALGRTFFGEGSFILLDEPTSDCSENLAASVAGMLQGLGTQVIVVSHRQGDTVNATNVIIL
jgi:DNA repair exonuclease SbcCD ATPase subunit